MALSGNARPRPRMDNNPAVKAFHELAVVASADAGETGQSLRDACLHLRFGSFEFLKGTWALHIDRTHPTISPLLDTLAAIPDTRRRVEHVFIEQAFGAAPLHDPAERARLVELEERSVTEVRQLLQLLAPTLRSIHLVCTSVEPTAAALRGGRVLKGMHFPVLQELAIAGPAETTAAFNLPLVPRLAPCLRRLQLPSDMLLPHLAHTFHATTPHLAHLIVSPLRPRYTVAQLETIHKFGENIGIFVVDGKDRVPSRSIAEPCIEVTAFMSLAADRVAEVGRLHWDLLGRMRPELPRTCLSFNVVERETEPSYEEVVAAARQEWSARRREILLG